MTRSIAGVGAVFVGCSLEVEPRLLVELPEAGRIVGFSENSQQSVELIVGKRHLVLQFLIWVPVLWRVWEILLTDGF
jgi:hypothetical protein